ncbi:hypothetical protein Ddye_015827 [Dipteronia dyeriana]|uniref:Uncharacterized protein n=1 Tax=Dipteronia dyeriana TaxID=168575 RepID=A0AAD9U6B6_9ROSI|nr:hypothetical protein Ddye_015827 [Dipteronia dyeriana]
MFFAALPDLMEVGSNHRFIDLMPFTPKPIPCLDHPNPSVFLLSQREFFRLVLGSKPCNYGEDPDGRASITPLVQIEQLNPRSAVVRSSGVDRTIQVECRGSGVLRAILDFLVTARVAVVQGNH